MRNANFRNLIVAVLVFLLVLLSLAWFRWDASHLTYQSFIRGETMTHFLGLPALAAIGTLALLSACTTKLEEQPVRSNREAAAAPSFPFRAQVVGVQWLNPLQRRDYSTEWQILWTLGLAQPNKNDDMVRVKPQKYSSLQVIAPIAEGNEGEETFKGYHHKYVEELTVRMFGVYFSSSRYFYNAHSLDDKSTWRELAGIHVEYAIPKDKLDPVEAGEFTRDRIIETFNIGNPNFPNAWTRATPPDVRITPGGPNAGFTSLSKALAYLEAHPNETVWAMNWDAPSRPKDEQINENMVLLVLAGPNYKTGRAALAWIGYPASSKVADFAPQKERPSAMQAWAATFDAATRNANKTRADIGYLIYDANNAHAESSDRLGSLAEAITVNLAGFDFMKQTFNTPALLGEMGAGTALTNVALAIGYANHLGKNVLVAGTTDLAQPAAVLVTPPAVVRPIDPEKTWFRARGENNAYLMWWGIRHDAKDEIQGYSK